MPTLPRLLAVALALVLGGCVGAAPWRTSEGPWDATLFAEAAQVRLTTHDGRTERLEDPRLVGEGPDLRVEGNARDAEDRLVARSVPLSEVAAVETRSVGAFRALAENTWGTVLLVGALLLGLAWILTDGEFRFGDGRF